MKKVIVICFFLFVSKNFSQVMEQKLPTANIRLSFLVFPPFSPLLTIEMRTFGNLTVQLETNFVNTHG